MTPTNHRRLALWLALCALSLLAGSCITAINNAKLKPIEGAPEVEKRADGCHVEVFQDGEAVTRPHADLGTVELDWPKKKIEEQGPEGAINTLKAFACEKGAFVIKDLRALAMGVGEGMIYEATFATLLGEDGKPLNPKGSKPEAAVDAGPAPTDPAPTSTPPPAGG